MLNRVERSRVAPVDDKVIHLSVDLPIDAPKAFACFTDSTLLKSWLALDADVEANGADPLTHVVVTFAARGSGSGVHLVHSGWRSTPEWEEARPWQERAWAGALEKLKSLAASPAQR